MRWALEEGRIPEFASVARKALRALDTSEALFAAFNAAGAFLNVQALEIHGPITETLLVQALAHVESRHPLLRARIMPCGPSLYWVEGNAKSPRISIIGDVPPGGLEALTQAELHRTYGATTERLWRCAWVPIDADHHWIVLTLHHAMADGISSMVIVRDLLETCDALIGLGELPPRLGLGRPLDEVLPPVSRVALLRHRVRRLRSRLLGPPPILPMEETAPPEHRRTALIFGSVLGDVILALQTGARRRGATINGVLAAAMLVAVRETLGPLPLVPVTHTVSMRGTAIPRNQVGCFVSNVVTQHPLHARWTFWREAQNATRQLHRAIERGEAAAALLAARGKVALASAAVQTAIGDRRTAGRIGAINISNRGLTKDLSAGQFRVVGWHPATSNHTFGNGVQISCATVGETFFFTLMHVVPLLSVASARRIADRVVECLARVARDDGVHAS